MLFMHDGRRLRNVSAQAGPIFERPLSVRGLAVGDTTNDGRLDVLLGINGGQPVLLRNATVGKQLGRREAAGRAREPRRRPARASRGPVQAGPRRSRLKTAGGSYLSSHDPREVLGIGAVKALDWVEVKWPAPSTLTERFDVPVNQYSVLKEESGRRV